MPQARLKPWRVLASDRVFQAPPWIEVWRQKIRLPEGKTIGDFHKIGLPDCVITVARTADDRFIFEKMYKHGLGAVGLFLPAGTIGAAERPLAAAKRELLEETGYRADHWRCLGNFICNANYGCGTAHIFLARGARLVSKPHSGDLEEIRILLLSPKKVLSAIRDGKISSLGSAAAAALALNPIFG